MRDRSINMSSLILEDIIKWVYQTSYFILADKEKAIAVAMQVAPKFKTFATKQKKREYKRYEGGASKKISLDTVQMIQYLTYCSTDCYEKMQETSAYNNPLESNLTSTDMVIRYIKQLIMIYMESNSFYSIVGQSCVLFNFDTSIVMRFYEVLVQCSDKLLDTKSDYSVRDAKRKIKEKLEKRFKQYITSDIGKRGEKYFESMEQTSDHFGLVKKCLHKLKPIVYLDGKPDDWCLPARFNPIDYNIETLNSDIDDIISSEENFIEIRRLHVAIHPCCFARLVRAFNHSYSRQHLKLPSFKIGTKNMTKIGPDIDRNDPPMLTPTDKELILSEFERESLRRRRAFTVKLLVLVDSREIDVWDLSEKRLLEITVAEDARVLEIIARGEEDDFSLATNLLQIDEDSETTNVVLEAGQVLAFTTEKIVDPESGEERLRVTITYQETALFRIIALYLQQLFRPQSASLLDRLLSPRGLATVTATLATLIFVSTIIVFTINRSANEMEFKPESIVNNGSQQPSANGSDNLIVKNVEPKIAPTEHKSRSGDNQDNITKAGKFRGGETTIYLRTLAEPSPLEEELLNKVREKIEKSNKLSIAFEQGVAEEILEIRIRENEDNRKIELRLLDQDNTLLWSKELIKSSEDTTVNLASTIVAMLEQHKVIDKK
ncbi:MAG: hypothetical protein AB1489_20860 [Acidobacteriota bacterium]